MDASVAKRHSISAVASSPSILRERFGHLELPAALDERVVDHLGQHLRVSPRRSTSLAPHGRTGCVIPSDSGASTWPQVVRCASPAGPREPANATFHPDGATAPVRPARESSDSRSTAASATVASREGDGAEEDEPLRERVGHAA